jgi:predicted alpha/beta hydrolase family esterase
MPPPQYVKLLLHCTANMVGKWDFAKFFYLNSGMLPNFCFVLPGLNNSGPRHWQTRWEERYGYTRIHQRDWDYPEAEDWIHTINEVIAPFPPESVILICHSLACCTAVLWARHYRRSIKGAFLVAPSDTEAPSYPPGTAGFTPMPLYTLPFPSIVVASTNDYYVTPERAQYFATHWGSRFVSVGPKGHINSDSNLGNWPEGHELLQTLF